MNKNTINVGTTLNIVQLLVLYYRINFILPENGSDRKKRERLNDAGGRFEIKKKKGYGGAARGIERKLRSAARA